MRSRHEPTQARAGARAGLRAAPHPILALQRAVGNRATTTVLARAADQERSWANPSLRPSSGDQELVATIHFATKDSTLDADDEAALRRVAEAYAPWAQAHGGLRGRVVGYADPRRSAQPDNAELSARRAHIVARQLIRFLVEKTTLISGAFDFAMEPRGVAPLEPKGKAEAVPLGSYRRAEVFIGGGAVAQQPPIDVPTPADPATLPKPVDDGYERWIPAIRQGDLEVTRDVAMWILGVMFVQRAPQWIGNYGGFPIVVPVGRFTRTPAGQDPAAVNTKTGVPFGPPRPHGATLPFRPRKPPWWDSRTSGYPMTYLGRQALSPDARKRAQFTDLTLMLIRDMRDFNRLHDLVVAYPSSAFSQYVKERLEDTPDVAKLRQLAEPIEYFLFVHGATYDLAGEVLQLARDLGVD